jgi:tripartite-type tricarboxylate transporter receptor subunit TctC
VGLFLVVTPSLPANIEGFHRAGEVEAGRASRAAPGGSINQLATEMFNRLADVSSSHPYKGSAPAVQDVMAGQAQLSFQTPATVLET